jgi:hypothetical protein
VTPAAPAYTLHMTLHARLYRGGWMHVYEIRRDGVAVGGMSVVRKTRSSPEVTTYATTDGTTYETKEALEAAVEADVAQRAAADA